MKVFISWSGEASKGAAEALADWLPRVIHSAKPWMSSRDIRSGKRWSGAIAKSLEESSFAILVVTHENRNAPWLHFEAGAVAKVLKDDARVVPFLVGGLQLASLEPPLSDFQGTVDEKEGTRKVVLDLLKLIPEPKATESVVSDSFERFWPDLRKKLDETKGPPAPAPERPDLDVLVPEIHRMVRDFSGRLSSVEAALEADRRMSGSFFRASGEAALGDPKPWKGSFVSGGAAPNLEIGGMKFIPSSAVVFDPSGTFRFAGPASILQVDSKTKPAAKGTSEPEKSPKE